MPEYKYSYQPDYTASHPRIRKFVPTRLHTFTFQYVNIYT